MSSHFEKIFLWCSSHDKPSSFGQYMRPIWQFRRGLVLESVRPIRSDGVADSLFGAIGAVGGLVLYSRPLMRLGTIIPHTPLNLPRTPDYHQITPSFVLLYETNRLNMRAIRPTQSAVTARLWVGKSTSRQIDKSTTRGFLTL